MATFNLTPEQLETAKKAKSPEELVEIAKAEGIAITMEQAKAFLTPPVGEISDEELENVAGGCREVTSKCSKCGAKGEYLGTGLGYWHWKCSVCMNRWSTESVPLY